MAIQTEKMSSEIRKVLVLLFCVANTLAIVPPFEIGSVADFDTSDVKTNYRLPNKTKPLEYDIALQTRIDEDEFDFYGAVTIRFEAIEKTQEVALHYRDLLIEEIELRSLAEKIEIFVPEYNRKSEILTIRTKYMELEPANYYVLIITYRGELRTDGLGFHRQSYLKRDGARKWIASTRFEPTYARYAFPCYDEPSFKANFTITITHGSKYNAVSNMPGETIVKSDEKSLTTFKTTPPISPYLIAFVISDFNYIEFGESAFKQKFFTNSEQNHTGYYVLYIGDKLIDIISKYLKVSYILPKLDRIAIPDQIGSNENWGIITHGQNSIFFNNKIHGFEKQTEIVKLISHGLSHQWFGNLVSVKWWSNLWLKEAFATLFEHIGTDKLYIDWNVFEFFVTQKLQKALQDDATPNTQPMTFYVEHPTSISNLFDKKIQSKSGSVLRMFMHALTEKAFQKGLKYYLEKNAYKTASDEDLFNALEKAAKKENTLDKELNVTALFSSWSNQKGFPLVTVSAKGELSQERYTAIHHGNNTNDTVWYIPYNFITSKDTIANPRAFKWLLPNVNSTRLNVDLGAQDWVVLNSEQTGFYRILYDANNYKQITNELINGDINKIPAISRSQIIDDLFDFVKTGRIQPTVYLDLIQYLKRENSFVAWNTAGRIFSYLDKVLAGSPSHEAIRNLAYKLTATFYHNYSIETNGKESHYNKYLHLYATNLACEYGNLVCLNQTLTQLEDIISSGQYKSVDYRSVIYANGVRTAGEPLLNKLWDRFIQVKNQDERNEIAFALGKIQNHVYLNQSLERVFVQNSAIKFAQAERVILLNSVIANTNSGVLLVIDALTRNADNAIKQLGPLSQIVLNIADYINNNETHDKFLQLLTTLKDKSSSKVDKQIIDRANEIVFERFKWLELHQSHFENYFKKVKSSATSMVVSIILIAAVVFKSVYS